MKVGLRRERCRSWCNRIKLKSLNGGFVGGKGLALTQYYLVKTKVHRTNGRKSRTTDSEKNTSWTTGHLGQSARGQTLPRINSTEYSIIAGIPTRPSYFKAHCLNWLHEPYILSQHQCVLHFLRSAFDVIVHNHRMLEGDMFYIPVTRPDRFFLLSCFLITFISLQ